MSVQFRQSQFAMSTGFSALSSGQIPTPAQLFHPVQNGIAVLALLLILVILRPSWAFSGVPPGKPDMTDRDTPGTAKLRESMVKNQIAARGIRDEGVLRAMARVPRHDFVPEAMKSSAYEDFPLPIGYGQTISQPYIVAFMTEAAAIGPEEKVLEIGTGSGYQAAVLAELAATVFTIEIVEPLGHRAAQTLSRLGYGNVKCRVGDGYAGWPDEAPFDAILVTAAPDHVPEPLVQQLREGGRIVIPVGVGIQKLIVAVKENGALRTVETLPVRFVPMTGKGMDEKKGK